MYLLFPEMSQLSTEEDSLDCGQEGAGEERVVWAEHLRQVALSCLQEEGEWPGGG